MTDVGRPYEARSLLLRVGRSGDIRPTSLHGRKHFAVPIVALVEGVVWPANTEHPEFVPAEVLAELPLGWNGKPVTQSHPQQGADYVSANSPDVYEKYAYGLIFNAQFKDNRLLMEAWIDPARIKPGSVAERSWEAIQRGEMVEVSVGAYITKLSEEGDYHGQHYHGVWQDIIPDHLAILAEGEIGACSIEMGCGALRVAVGHKHHIHTINSQGGIEVTEVEPMSVENPPAPVALTVPAKKSWSQRFQEALARITGLQSADDMTTNDLSEKLDRALRSTKPGYLGVVAVKPEAHEVVFAVYPEERVIYYQQTYAVSDDGELSLEGDPVEVVYERIERYTPVAAAAAPSAPHGDCGCKNKPAAAVQTDSPQGETDMKKEVLIHALVGSGKFAETQRPFLDTLEESVLQSMLDAPAPAAATAPAPAPAPAPAIGALASASPQTMEQFIQTAHPSLQPELRAAAAMRVAKRNATIMALKGTGRCTFTDEQLATKTDQELDQLSALAATPVAADFSGRGLPSGTEGEDVPEPPSLTSAIQNRRVATGRQTVQ